MKKIVQNISKIVLIGIIIIGFYLMQDNKEEINNSNIDSYQKQEELNQNSDQIEIYYFDVGEADATFIRYKNYNFLIDAGNTVDGKNIVKYLKELGIDHFNSVYATHAHEDHIGGMHWIIYKFPVEHFYMPNHKAEWKSYENLMNALQEKKIEVEEPIVNQEIIYDDLKMMVLWVGHDPEDYNENSIILKINYKNTSYLFMADAEESVEHEILNKDMKSDVLKVGHHGSKYATTANFLYQVDPKYAIISVGKDNEYGHPHQVTLDKLNKMNIKIYRTDQDHTIHLISDGEIIEIDTIKTNLNGGDLNH